MTKDLRQFTKQLTAFVRRVLQDESGQGINEYAAILAFLATCIFLVFVMSNGTLGQALSGAFSNMVNEMDRLTSYSSGT